MQTATIHLDQPDPDGKMELYFASLDGDHFLPVTRLPMAGEEADVAKLFDGRDGFKPMTWAPRGLQMIAAVDRIEFGEV